MAARRAVFISTFNLNRVIFLRSYLIGRIIQVYDTNLKKIQAIWAYNVMSKKYRVKVQKSEKNTEKVEKK